VSKGDAKLAAKKINESEINEMKKPKSWDTMFAMNAIADYEAGKFDPDDDASLAKWEKDYNGGVAPKPGFETYDIIAYALMTGKKPDGTPIKESVEVNEGKFTKDKLLKLISKLDDAEITVKGKTYIIYNPDSNNDDNAAMWGNNTIKALNSDGDEFEFKYSEIEDFDGSIKYESVVTEARSINKIQKDWSKVTSDMKETVDKWKAAEEGELKTSLLAKLKSLTAQKHELEAELNAAVQLKDVDAELVGEAWVGPFQFTDKMSDDELKKMYDEAVSGYANWQKGFEHPKSDYKKAYQEIAKILKKRGVVVESVETNEGNAFGAARAEAIAKGEKTFKVNGEEYDVESVDKEDKENAKEFVEEAKLTKAEKWMQLAEKLNRQLNEDLRADLKKFIKANQKELNELADADNWDAIHDMLRTEFDVKEGSKQEDELFTTFNFVF
jgi:hypothetical protein